MRILIVEDDEDSRLYLERALESSGHEVEAAEDGLVALQAAYDTTPDIIIADILMPRMDGYLLCRNIKAEELLKDTPFIFYTATYVDPKDKELGLSIGAARYLEKPMELSELLKIIEDVKEEAVSGQLTGPDAAKRSAREIDRDYQQALARKLDKKVAELEKLYEASRLNQEMLRQSEEKFRDFASAASDWFWEMNADLRYTCLSDRFETITEVKIADCVGIRPWDYADPQDESGKWAKHKADLEARRPFRDFEYIAVLGVEKQFYLRSSGVPVLDSDGEFTGYRGSTTDISERKRVEQDLRRYKDIVSTSTDFLSFVDRDYVYRAINDTYLKVFEKSRDEIVGHTVSEILGKEGFGGAVKKNIDRCLSGDSTNFKKWLDFPTGARRCLDMHFEPFLDEDGSISGVVVNGRDITELKKQKDLLSEAQEITHIGSWEFDLTENEMSWSDELYRIFEIDPKEFDASYESFLALVHPDDLEMADKAYTESVRNKTLYEVTVRLLMKDERVKYVNQRGQTFYDKDGEPIRSIGTTQDITEQQQVERMLRRTQKMEAIGQLAGGIAHDFNNLLSIFQGNFELLEDLDVKDEDFEELLETGRKAVQRGSSLTHRLLSLSRSDAMDTKVISVNAILGDMHDLLIKSLTLRVKIKLSLNENVWLININTDELEDAIVNLALNARDAMPEGGSLVIETTNALLDEEYAGRNPGVEPGEYVSVSVSDTGFGMDQKTLERVYEPFFTTKEEERGTGLGLSMVYGFIKRSKGHMKIDSEPGHGTTVRLYFPKSERTDREQDVSEASKTKLPGGEETVLVVDDEPDILNGIKRRLEPLGYQVLTAGDAYEALEMLGRHIGKIALLFSDVVMPGEMDGYALAEEAVKREPDLKVLLTSGFTYHTVKESWPSLCHVEILSKPYTKTTLANKVRHVLDSA